MKTEDILIAAAALYCGYLIAKPKNAAVGATWKDEAQNFVFLDAKNISKHNKTTSYVIERIEDKERLVALLEDLEPEMNYKPFRILAIYNKGNTVISYNPPQNYTA